MWSRKELKDQAKEVMKRSYWKMFLVSLLVVVLIGLFDDANSGSKITYELSESVHFDLNQFISYLPFHKLFTLTAFSIFAILITLFGICYSVFIANPISFGESKYYLENTKEDVPFITLFSAFQQGYTNIVKILLIRDIKIFLWSLLFVIPGIIKSYEYRMIPYLLAEDPNLSVQEAFDATKQLTNGQKLDIWILDLSFIGWLFLGALLFGIGVYFVNPYIHATNAQLYLALRDQQAESNYFG